MQKYTASFRRRAMVETVVLPFQLLRKQDVLLPSSPGDLHFVLKTGSSMHA